jgi:hypothetical protein
MSPIMPNRSSIVKHYFQDSSLRKSERGAYNYYNGKENLWPWRYWMTIGIGVLAAESKKPDSLIMIADSMGSFEDTHSTSELHKLHALEADNLYAVSADRIDRAAELINVITNVLRKDFVGQKRGYAQIVQALAKGAAIHKEMCFKLEAPSQFRIDAEDWVKIQDPAFRDSLLAAYQPFYVGCATIIGIFDDNGQAYLFHLPGNGIVENVTFPGFAAIGTGAPNAVFWLAYRKQKLSFSVRRSAYHLYEAKRMAENSPHVNENIDLVVAKKGKHFLLYQDRKRMRGCPVSLVELGKMFKKFNVQDTGFLDPPDQKNKPIFQL